MVISLSISFSMLEKNSFTQVADILCFWAKVLSFLKEVTTSAFEICSSSSSLSSAPSLLLSGFYLLAALATAASAKSSSLVSSPTVGKSSSTLTRATKSTPCNVELLRNLDLTFSFTYLNHLNIFLESVTFLCVPHGQLYNDSD